jgi:hypothetical protein
MVTMADLNLRDNNAKENEAPLPPVEANAPNYHAQSVYDRSRAKLKAGMTEGVN